MTQLLNAQTLWSLPRISSPALSPDGQTAAFCVGLFDENRGELANSIHLISVAGREPRRLTGNSGKDSSPNWSPDGTRLAFVRSTGPGEPAQVWVIRVDGGEAEKLTSLPVGVNNPRWHPDGNRIVFSAPLPGGCADWEAVEEILAERKERKVTARTTEHRLYRFWNRWLHEEDYPHLFQVALDSGEVTDLTPGWQQWFDLGDDGCDHDIAPDGSALLFSAMTTLPPHDEPLRWGIYRLELDGAAGSSDPVELTSGLAGSWSGPVHSPGGESFAFGWRRDPKFYADPVRLGVWGTERKILTQEWDRSAAGWAWRPDGTGLVFSALDGHDSKVFGIPADGSATAPALLLDGGTAGSTCPLPDGRVLCVINDVSTPPELAVSRAGAGASFDRITDLATSGLSVVELSEAEEIFFPGADGDQVGMLLLRPPGFDSSRKYPLVQLVHGGPHGQFGNTWHWRWSAQAFAAMGYVVSMVNFHGSTGWGDAYTRSILGEHPIKPFKDVMAGTDHVVGMGFIDEDRMAVAGGSYGGFLVTWIVGHTNRFRCSINHAGVIDLMAQMGSDVTHGRLEAYGGEPWSDLAAIEQHSPARFSADMETPMLVIHGEKDYRVPVGNALEIYGILKAKGVPARLVTYPDEGHWILSPGNSLHWYGEVKSWLERWLGA